MRRAALAAGALLAAVTVAGCTDADPMQGKVFGQGAAVVEEVGPTDRGAVIDASGPAVDGGAVDLAAYRGKVTVVNFWWSGCGPCVRELPLLVRSTADLGPDVALVGVNVLDASSAAASAFERSLEVDFPSVYDPGGQVLLDFDGEFSPRNVPSTIVLDREGRVAARISGEVPSELTLTDVVERVLEDPAGGAA